MKKFTVLMTVMVSLTVGLHFSGCDTPKSEDKSQGIVLGNSKADTIAHGAYLVTSMGCNDCHSPKVMTPQGPMPDSSKLFSGYPANSELPKIDKNTLKSWLLFNQDVTAFVGPWGISFAANLTSDETGIGSWSEAQFIRAIREGKAKGLENGRSLLPPMPWPFYSKLNDTDLKAIFSYLKSTQPIKNVVPAPVPPDKIP